MPLPSWRVVENALDDSVSGRRRSAVGLAPIVRIDLRADDDVAHGLRNRQHLNFAGGFRLMIDAVGRTEEKSFHAEIAFEEQLGEVQFDLQLRFRNRFKIGMSEGVITDFVSRLVFAF